MIEMRMGQQDVVDAGGIEAERPGIFLVQLAAALIQPAVDQDSLARTFNQVTGAGDTAICSMERYFQAAPLYIR